MGGGGGLPSQAMLISLTPFDNFGAAEPVVYRGAYEYGFSESAEDFVPQHLAPGVVVRKDR